MLFETISGNEPIKSYLRSAVEEERLAQTLLFEGMEGIGKSLFANELASFLLKAPLSQIPKETHPAFHALRPEGKSGLHAIEELRACIDKVHEAPFTAHRKVFVIHDAERMQTPSANALLKTLEEPPLDTTLILLTSQTRDILPTILSRCIQLHFHPLPLEAIATILKSQGLNPDFAALSHGSAGVAMLLATDNSFVEMQNGLLHLLSKPLFYPDLIDGIESIESLLEPIKAENPISYHRRVDLLFATLLMWARDQVMRPIGGAKLFFADQPETKFLGTLPRFEEKIQEARSAFQRNIKLSSCLEQCFLAFARS